MSTTLDSYRQATTSQTHACPMTTWTAGFKHNCGGRWRWQHRTELDGEKWSVADVPLTESEQQGTSHVNQYTAKQLWIPSITFHVYSRRYFFNGLINYKLLIHVVENGGRMNVHRFFERHTLQCTNKDKLQQCIKQLRCNTAISMHIM